jgi:hypothetical protein
MKIVKSNDILTEKEYIVNVNELIEKSRNIDATVIPHTIDELLYRFDKSIVYINNDKVL